MNETRDNSTLTSASRVFFYKIYSSFLVKRYFLNQNLFSKKIFFEKIFPPIPRQRDKFIWFLIRSLKIAKTTATNRSEIDKLIIELKNSHKKEIKSMRSPKEKAKICVNDTFAYFLLLLVYSWTQK